MRPGPPRGASATRTVTITRAETSRATERSAPEIYGPEALVAHAVSLCREILTPHLEPGEVAIGVSVEVRHRAPVPIGTQLTLVASVASVATSRLVCEVLARDGSVIIARGSVEHETVTQTVLAERLAARSGG